MPNPKYDLEIRTANFAHDNRRLYKTVSKQLPNLEDFRQLNRSSGSVAANYIEANEALSYVDFIHRVKIYRKVAKESWLWLSLLDIPEKSSPDIERQRLMQEATELTKIFGAIIEKTKKKRT